MAYFLSVFFEIKVPSNHSVEKSRFDMQGTVMVMASLRICVFVSKSVLTLNDLASKTCLIRVNSFSQMHIDASW